MEALFSFFKKIYVYSLDSTEKTIIHITVETAQPRDSLEGLQWLNETQKKISKTHYLPWSIAL